ncbi:metacaspase-1 isoform X1 [Setaria italica]|uniref:Peptidase C14 caspase domain-containing protein n=1 Tax=Setaria italica TaxID=4555 RepID=K4ABG3_SETIT|nr:metacaspase-1 isoform X1 [Setaria italica]
MSHFGGHFGGRPHGAATTTVRCKYCRASLTAIPGERAIQCAHCNCVTRIRRADRIPLPVMGPMTAPFQRARGKKRAVLVGITYAGMRRGCGELRGPINDVKCMRNLLCQRFGFPSECVIMLTDDQRDPFRLPTKDNIRMAMHWLVQGCSYGDSLVFHFSGLGAQVADDDGDEVDGYDEALCPMDAFQKGPILDDEINEVMVRPLVHGARLHAVVDACYSATVLDLPFLCRVARNGYWQWEDHRPPSGAWKGTSGGQAVLFSGYSDGKSNFAVMPDAYASVGAMTHSFIRAVECEPRGVTYGRLLSSMRTIMKNGGGGGFGDLQGPIGAPIHQQHQVANFSGVQNYYSLLSPPVMLQEPNLSSSEMFDIHRKPFVM